MDIPISPYNRHIGEYERRLSSMKARITYAVLVNHRCLLIGLTALLVPALRRKTTLQQADGVLVRRKQLNHRLYVYEGVHGEK